MRVQVVVSGWEQGCCGQPFATGADITWQLVAEAEHPAGVLPRFAEEHHDQTPGGVPHPAVTGRVVRIDAVHYPLLPVTGEPRSFTWDTAHPQLTLVDSVSAGGDDADEYWVEFDVADAGTLPAYVPNAGAEERHRDQDDADARNLARRDDATGRLLEALADDAVARFGDVAAITRDAARSAITIEPHREGATAVRWARSAQETDGISAHVGEGHWWALPADAEGASTVRGLLDAAAAGRVREDVVVLDGHNRRLDTVAWDERGRPWTASITIEPHVLGEGGFAVAGDGWHRAERGPHRYAAWR